MGVGGAAPAAGGAEVGGGHRDDPGEAPLWVVAAPQLVAGAAAEPVVEEGGAECRRVRPIPLAVQIPIPARPTFISNRNTHTHTHTPPPSAPHRFCTGINAF